MVTPVDNSREMSLGHIYPSYLATISLKSNSSMYDMNQLPYMSQLRTILLIVCCFMFVTAACVYFPLGYIQADHEGKCFLHTNPEFDHDTAPQNDSEPPRLSRLRLNPVRTAWGPVFSCNFTTFTSVTVAIFAMIIGWSTFTVWPTMMEIGKGGVLMLVYAFLFALCLGSTVASTIILSHGYSQTCYSMERNTGMSCEDLAEETVSLRPQGEDVVVKDIHQAISIAQVASAGLAGLSLLQIVVSLTTFGTIWFHFHYLAVQMYTLSPSMDRWPDGNWAPRSSRI